MAELEQLALDVESAWGAVAGLPRLRFPRPLAEPDVRLSPHPALHRTHAAAAMTAQRCSLVCISRTRVCGAAAFAAASSGIAVPFCQSPAACRVPEVGPGSLTSGDRWSDMIPRVAAVALFDLLPAARGGSC